MANYKTPGVYVNEVSLLPPSVAPVATAIPAFIGYTEKAVEKGSLHLKPFRISSILDYETYFGYAYPQENIEIKVDGNTITEIKGLNSTPSYKMYYALQMYFANGGGPCYIVSIGKYGDPASAISVADHEAGLVAVEKEDEPTLLVFPDATGLSNEFNYYSIINKGLAQSNKLQDRFTIIDTYRDGAIGTSDNPIPELRDNIINDENQRKYGAAYYPYLKTIIDYHYNDSEVKVDILDSNLNFTDYINSIWNEIVIINTNLNSFASSFDNFKDDLTNSTETNISSEEKSQGLYFISNFISIFKNYQNKFTELIAVFNHLSKQDSSIDTNLGLLKTWVETNIDDNTEDIQDYLSQFKVVTALSDAVTIIDDINDILIVNVSGTPAIFDFTSSVNALNAAAAAADNYVYDISSAIASSSSVNNEKWILSLLKNYNNLLYNQIKQAIADTPMLLPPSSAIAGVYARIDNSVGVWKAPANAGLMYVIAPSQIVSNDDQEDMNVTDTGKSVNAIRSFTGKGTLVWGARTLDGNSNEWRYINVRRFYNFAEESIRKATEPFVFQSNDANTWVMMRGMIESFLTLQWKAGALAGASTEQAFYVKVGLGTTMTPQDVLEGRMIVEIGMAVVRPAEFIILRFTHKMQEI